jgi:hypothetical protein
MSRSDSRDSCPFPAPSLVTTSAPNTRERANALKRKDARSVENRTATRVPTSPHSTKSEKVTLPGKAPSHAACNGK